MAVYRVELAYRVELQGLAGGKVARATAARATAGEVSPRLDATASSCTGGRVRAAVTAAGYLMKELPELEEAPKPLENTYPQPCPALWTAGNAVGRGARQPTPPC